VFLSSEQTKQTVSMFWVTLVFLSLRAAKVSMMMPKMMFMSVTLMMTKMETSKAKRTYHLTLFSGLYDSRTSMSPMLPEDRGPSEKMVRKQWKTLVHWFSPASPKLGFQKLSMR